MRSKLLYFFCACTLSIQALATVIGDDNREAATFADKETSGIGMVHSRFSVKNNLYQCTGTLIEEKFILTAAHCVFKYDKGGFAQEISFSPSIISKNDNKPAKYSIEKIWVASQFINAEKNGFAHSWKTDRSDIALLRIKHNDDSNLGNLFGIKALTNDFDAIVEGKKYLGNFASFPSDKPFSLTPWKETACEYWAPDEGTFNTSCDTAIGSSGGALLSENNQIIGIISSFSINLNYAARITLNAAMEISTIIAGDEEKVGYFVPNNLLGPSSLAPSANLTITSK